MAKVRDFKGGRLGAAKKTKRSAKGQPENNGTPQPKPEPLTLANYPLYQTKFMESIAFYMRDLVVELKKTNLMMGDITKKIRDDG